MAKVPEKSEEKAAVHCVVYTKAHSGENENLYEPKPRRSEAFCFGGRLLAYRSFWHSHSNSAHAS